MTLQQVAIRFCWRRSGVQFDQTSL